MFDFIRKEFLWHALDQNRLDEIRSHEVFHLKTIQDLAVWEQIREHKDRVIGEIGGGDSRILPALANHNTCFNIEKFDGTAAGPSQEIAIPEVENIHAFMGGQSGLIPFNYFDTLFSVSVVEHIDTKTLEVFIDEAVKCLRVGGTMIHAIDLYLEDEPNPATVDRYNRYLSWLGHPSLEPIGQVVPSDLRFSCSMATNPDTVMYRWAKTAPALDSLRKRAQSVSLLVGLRKRSA